MRGSSSSISYFVGHPARCLGAEAPSLRAEGEQFRDLCRYRACAVASAGLHAHNVGDFREHEASLTEESLGETAARELGALNEQERQLLVDLTSNRDFSAVREGDGVHPEIRATVIVWLCASRVARASLGSRGIRIFDAHIIGVLDLQFLAFAYPIIFERCVFRDRVDICFAQITQLRLYDCALTDLFASQVQVVGSIFLSRSRFSGEVRLQGARIGGNLRFFDSQMRPVQNSARAEAMVAVNLEGATIQGSVHFTGNAFVALGPLRLFGTTIGLNLECSGTVWHPGGDALVIEQAKVQGSILLRSGFRALGRVRVFDSAIAGSLDLQGSRLATRHGLSLLVAGSNIGRSLLLRDDRQARSGSPFRCIRSVAIQRTVIGENFDCTRADIRARGSAALELFDVVIRGRLIAKALVARGHLRLHRTGVGNDVELTDARVAGEAEEAIAGVGVTCGGNFFLNGAYMTGAVNLTYLNVGNDLLGEGLAIETRTGDVALILSHAKLGGGVRLHGCRLSGRLVAGSTAVKGAFDLRDGKVGSVSLAYATVGLDLLLGGASIGFEVQSSSFDLAYASIQGSLSADRRASFVGSIRLTNCSINGNVALRDASIDAGEHAAIQGSFVEVGNNFSADKCRLTGRVDLAKARIEGMLDLNGTSVEAGKNIFAVFAAGAGIDGGVQIGEGFSADGAVNFDRANIAGDISIGQCRITSHIITALSLRAITLAGDLYAGISLAPGCDWQGSDFVGGIDISRATITGDVDLSSARLIQQRGEASLTASRARIDGSLRLTDDFHADGVVDLSNAKIQTIQDEKACWPVPGKLLLEGLTYETLKPLAASDRVEWLQLGRAALIGRNLSWQPYEQLAKALQQQGLDRDMREVMIAKQRQIRTVTKSAWHRAWLWLIEWTMAYGYKPQRALAVAPLLILTMTIVFASGGRSLMVPVSDKAWEEVHGHRRLVEGYPAFSPLIYSIDTLIPIISLQQKDFWRPDSAATCSRGIPDCGWWLRVSLWLYVAAGWVVTTLAVAGFTGLIRKS